MLGAIVLSGILMAQAPDLRPPSEAEALGCQAKCERLCEAVKPAEEDLLIKLPMTCGDKDRLWGECNCYKPGKRK